ANDGAITDRILGILPLGSARADDLNSSFVAIVVNSDEKSRMRAFRDELTERTAADVRHDISFQNFTIMGMTGDADVGLGIEAVGDAGVGLGIETAGGDAEVGVGTDAGRFGPPPGTSELAISIPFVTSPPPGIKE